MSDSMLVFIVVFSLWGSLLSIPVFLNLFFSSIALEVTHEHVSRRSISRVYSHVIEYIDLITPQVFLPNHSVFEYIIKELLHHHRYFKIIRNSQGKIRSYFVLVHLLSVQGLLMIFILLLLNIQVSF
jgi:hypothetical protein